LKEDGKYIRGLIPWLGFQQEPYYYNREARMAGETKYPLHKMLKLAANGILSLSSKPLEKILTLGVFSLTVACLMIIYTLISFLHPAISVEPGWASLMIVILFFSSMILISLGIIGMYISRIFNEVKNRPEYIIESIIN
jgi:dolichol-phosphate mannosyltransferase